ncbi:MAG: OmpA family protein [Thermodesulfobacteriota bacterium]|jgi:outer membrane protein OmpA-like peptidoglycan-associated protein
MHPYKFFSVCVLLLGFAASCCCTSGRNIFVLLSDPDGKTGKIAVSNKGGSQLLQEPRQATEVKGIDQSPTAPFLMDEKQIQENFGSALEAQPAVPIRFILYFKGGSSELTDESAKKIPEILRTFSIRKPAEVSIIGHTDRVGSREANFNLGFNRANVVRDMLTAGGLDAQSIEVYSHGKDNPLIKTEDEVPEPRNRRVEVTIR